MYQPYNNDSNGSLIAGRGFLGESMTSTVALEKLGVPKVEFYEFVDGTLSLR